MPGIMTSSRIRSGCHSRACLIASNPSRALGYLIIFGRKLGFQQPRIGRNVVNDENARCHGLPGAADVDYLAITPLRDRIDDITIILVAVAFVVLLVLLPVIAVFAEALRKGIDVYVASITDHDALSALRLTLLTAAVSVTANLVFGVAAAWAIAKFEFPGKSALLSLIDLPFAVSPVISGLVFVLLFGAQGWFGGWLIDHNVQIVFASLA